MEFEEYLNSLGPQEVEAFAMVQMGVEAEQFARSSLGRYVIGRAKLEERQAIEKLATLDPSNVNAIRQTQSDLLRARSFPQWILELVQDGEEAERQLRNIETEA